MKRFWNERARVNAHWYIDTSLDYDKTDVDRFFEHGREIVESALANSPAEPAAKDLAVEIGCGIGRSCLALADQFDRVVGVDISEEMIERAKTASPHSSIDYVVGDGISLTGVDDNSADLVFSYSVFIHAPRRSIVDRYILDVGRVLKPGGIFVFDWNNSPGSLRWALRRRALQVLRGLRLKRDEQALNHAAFVGSAISTRRIARVIKRAGLETLAIKNPGRISTFCYARRPDRAPNG